MERLRERLRTLKKRKPCTPTSLHIANSPNLPSGFRGKMMKTPSGPTFSNIRPCNFRTPAENPHTSTITSTTPTTAQITPKPLPAKNPSSSCTILRTLEPNTIVQFTPSHPTPSCTRLSKCREFSPNHPKPSPISLSPFNSSDSEVSEVVARKPKPRPQDRPKGKENNYGLSSLSSFDSGTKQNPRASSPKLNGKRERAENDRPSQRQRLGSIGVKMCPVCMKDGSNISWIEFELHLTDCLDTLERGSIVTRDMEREKARIEREEEDKKNSRISKNFSEVTTGEPIGEQEGGLGNARYECSYCGKDLSKVAFGSRVKHIKACEMAPKAKRLQSEKEGRTKVSPEGKITDFFAPKRQPKNLRMNATWKKLLPGALLLGKKKPNELKHTLQSKRGGAWGSFQQRVPYWKKIEGTNFIVDGFSFANRSPPNIFFLTHFHSDHYGGLTRHFSGGPIYCTKVTARLIGAQYGLRHCVHPVSMNKTVDINGVKVTFFDANHCPGSAMILFETKGRRLLHVGDFRYHPRMKDFPILKELKRHDIDVCYLDTTYCDPKRNFPTQDHCIRYVASESGKILKSKGKVLIVLGAYSIGKERVQLAVAKACKSKIYVDPRRFKTYTLLDLPFSDLDFTQIDTQRPSALDRFMLPKKKSKNSGKIKISENIENDLLRKDYERAENVPEGGLEISREILLSSEQKLEQSHGEQDKKGLHPLFRKLSPEEMQTLLERESINKHLLSQEDRPTREPEKSQNGTGKRRAAKSIVDVYTTNPRSSKVHVVPMGWLSYDKLASYAKSIGSFDHVVGFRPTGWSGPRCKKTSNGFVTLHHVPYSEHSTFNELKDFVRWLKPRKIIPTVNIKEWRKLVKYFEDC
ncbi:hypothetical protein AAMO2058_000161100 [Amorphochlora amoebiformis]